MTASAGQVPAEPAFQGMIGPAAVCSAIVLAAGAGLALFGLPAADLHGPLHYVGVMDPLCGGTRAARYTMRGEWALAWRYNPLGIVTVVAAAVILLRTVVGVVTGHWLSVAIQWTAGRSRLVTFAAAILLIALEVRQQVRVDLLR